MSDAPSFTDLFNIARNEALIRNGRLTAEAVERPGTDANIIAAAVAAVGQEVGTQIVRVEAGLFLDSATGPALDKLVFDRYGLLRKNAANAIGTVQFTSVTGAAAAFTIPTGTVLQASNGDQYTTSADVVYPDGSNGPVNVPIRSTLAGLDQQASVNTVTSIVSTPIGAPNDFAVSNVEATAGADNAETDDSLRNRARNFFQTTRRGTKLAIEQAALAFPGVETAQAFEVLDGNGIPARLVQLIVSDSFTDTLASYTSTPPPSYQVQSQQLAIAIFQSLDDVRAAGIYVDVIVAQVIMLPVVLRLAFAAGVDTTAVTEACQAAVVNYTNSLPPGATWSVLGCGNSVRAVGGLSVTGNEIASPVGDVVPTPLQVIRTGLAIVAPS